MNTGKSIILLVPVGCNKSFYMYIYMHNMDSIASQQL